MEGEQVRRSYRVARPYEVKTDGEEVGEW